MPAPYSKDLFEVKAEYFRGQSYDTMELKRKAAKQGCFSDEVKNKYGCVFTPQFVVDKTIDLAWKYYTLEKLSATYCDPACGDGNFLHSLYDRLMLEPSDLDPITKSRHILTKCLYGFEIISHMVLATKTRLLIKHLETVRAAGGDPKEHVGIYHELHVYHGNTILTGDDTPFSWAVKPEKYEGGLLPTELRERKFDVIVGNPPYTDLRNLGNRRYHSYPQQRDLAQVFIRWALDHLTTDGICSYNITEVWLIKINGGAKETRRLLLGRMLELLQDTDIRRYSEGEGGDLGTCICAFSRKIGDQKLEYNSNSISYNGDFLEAGFLQKLENNSNTYQFHNTPITNYAPILAGGRSINKFGTHTENWKSFIFKQYTLCNEYRLITKRRVMDKSWAGSWKLIENDDFKSTLDAEYEGEVKNTIVSKVHGLWLIGYLNTKTANNYVKSYTRCRMAGNYELSNNLWPMCQVPDYDWYLTNKPQQTKEYLDWIESNMRNKDTFLAGIDEQFEKLIK